MKKIFIQPKTAFVLCQKKIIYKNVQFESFVFFFQILLFFGCDLLSSLSQLVTLPFQSQVCLSMSNANPLGQVICFRPDLVHLDDCKKVREQKKNCFSNDYS